jgi:hypothetical protein
MPDQKMLEQVRDMVNKMDMKAFTLGISQGIEELALAALPFYADLTLTGIDKLATKVFSIVDTNALDFMAQYNLTLAGDVYPQRHHLVVVRQQRRRRHLGVDY